MVACQELALDPTWTNNSGLRYLMIKCFIYNCFSMTGIRKNNNLILNLGYGVVYKYSVQDLIKDGTQIRMAMLNKSLKQYLEFQNIYATQIIEHASTKNTVGRRHLYSFNFDYPWKQKILFQLDHLSMKKTNGKLLKFNTLYSPLYLYLFFINVKLHLIPCIIWYLYVSNIYN